MNFHDEAIPSSSDWSLTDLFTIITRFCHRSLKEMTEKECASLLQPLIVSEFKKAHSFDTKAVILSNVHQKVGDVLGVQRFRDTKGVYVSRKTVQRLDRVFQELLSRNHQAEQLAVRLTTLKLKDYHDSTFLKHLFRDLFKWSAKDEKFLSGEKSFSNEMSGDTPHKDHLHRILAVDGFSGLSFGDVISNYHAHLGIEDQHVVAVHQMYDEIPGNVGGFEASTLIAKALLELYAPFWSSDEDRDLVRAHLKQIPEVLGEPSDPLIQRLMQTYKNSVKDVETLAMQKLTSFKHFCKKKSMATKKRKNEDADYPIHKMSKEELSDE